MRILHVVHGLPPDRAGGTETYTWQLARAQAARGHEVEVLAAAKDVGRADLSLSSTLREGVLVHDYVNNLLHESFRSTWDDPRALVALRPVLERGHDVVHVQHLVHLGSELPFACARRGAAVLMTLHDYWPHCARHGQRLHPDGTLCATIDTRRCGGCLLSFEHNQGALERRFLPLVRAVKRASGLDLAPAARRAKAWAGGGGRGKSDPDAAARLAAEVDLRNVQLRERLVAGVRRFLAPSKFVLERSVADGGLPRERIVHLPFGIPATGVRRAAASGSLRVGFLGARLQAKGPDLLLRAWAALPADLRARGTLRVCGSDRNEAAYQTELRRLAAACGARLEGALDRTAVARFLEECDLLVVPSRWWENAPLVVQEARAARVPLLVADHGGLAEFVEEGRDGWRFAPGSVEALGARLAAVLSGELDTARLDPRPVPAWDWHVDQVESHYRAAAAGAAP